MMTVLGREASRIWHLILGLPDQQATQSGGSERDFQVDIEVLNLKSGWLSYAITVNIKCSAVIRNGLRYILHHNNHS